MMHTAKEWRIVLRVYDAVMVFLVVLLLALATKWYLQTGQVRAPASYGSLLWLVVWVILRGVAKKKKDEAELAESKSAQPPTQK